MQKDLYIEPITVSNFKKLLDKLCIAGMVLMMLAMIALAVYIVANTYGYSIERSTEQKLHLIFMIYVAVSALVYWIVNPKSRKAIPDPACYQLIKSLSSEKAKKNIMYIIKVNGKITFGELKAIRKAMILELDQIYKSSYLEMIKTQQVPGVTKENMIVGMKNDIQYIQSYSTDLSKIK